MIRLALLFLLLAPAWLGAQQEQPRDQPRRVQGQQPRLPEDVSEAEVLARLRASGMTRQQARARLAQLGYDPAMADPYFDRLEGRTNQSVPVQDSFVRALQSMGLITPVGPDGVVGDSLSLELDTIPGDSLPDRDLEPDTFQIFGRSVFSAAGTQFQPLTLGPVDAGYRLGPGDELFLVLTGDVEIAHSLNVTREGFVVIPDVGQIVVNGLTLDGLRNQLYERLGRVYSGVRRGPGATTFFDISLGRLRVNQIFVVGDAVRPGAYQVSAAATVFNALQRAGGPSDLGSFRSVQVRRGAEIVAAVDLYDYLIGGDASRDVRLDQGDIVFVPPAGPQVSVLGSIRRPAIYEMREGEGLRELLAFAGGLQAEAAIQRVQIDRILPPAERIPGVDRVLLDVDLRRLYAGDEVIQLRDGDEVHLFASLAERRNRVVLVGSVYHPGLYEYRPGMTVWDLIGRADGLAEQAFRGVAHVFRPVLATGGHRLLPVSLETDASGAPIANLLLEDRDSVMVYAADSLSTQGYVQIEGLVKRPGPFPFASGTTVRDLIVAAGGFQEGAEAFRAEVVRLRQGQSRNDTLASRATVALEADLPASWAPVNGQVPAGVPTGGAFELQEGDRVFIRKMPGYVTPLTVFVQGEILNAGPYALQLRSERLSSVMGRAGGTTGDAYIPGARLLRDSVLVGIDLEEALRRPGGREDVVLEDGDVITVPSLDPTVLVQGAVAFESRVLFREGDSVKDYLDQAGGPLQDADLGRVSVLYPNGQRATVGRALWFRTYPEVQPGSTIFVPRAADGPGTNWSVIITTTVSAISALATLLFALNSL